MNLIKEFVVRASRKWFDIASREMFDTSIKEIRSDVFAAQILSSLNGKYVPWTMPALRPAALATLLNDIMINERETIVECGGGVSTIYIARLLKQMNRGHLYTIEHDARWLEILREQIHGEEDRVTLIHAPIQSPGKTLQGEWYNEDIVIQRLKGVQIDLLIVDGPNETLENPQARYPALPILQPLFSKTCAVALDDVNRKGERAILAEWQKKINLRFHIVSNMAIGLHPQAYKSFIA